MEKIHGNFCYDATTTPQSVVRNPESTCVIDRIFIHFTHDTIIYHNGLKKVCLNVFQGNKSKPFKHAFVKDIDDEAAQDLEERTDGFLPAFEVKEARTLMRQLGFDPEFKRSSYFCDVCKQN